MTGQTIQWSIYSSPGHLYRLAGRLIPWCAVPAAVLLIVGLFLGLFVAPADFQQGDAYRVLFVHVPAAWLGMLLYLLLAFYAALGLIFNTRVSSMMASSLANTGAMFTLLALVTGSLWGRPTWGTWWVWDARTTSTLILLFLYVGFISLQSAIADSRRADRAGAVLALVGVVNVPIIYFSVEWWSTLHQGATIRIGSQTTMAGSMLAPLLVMLAACWFYSIAVVLVRLRCLILEREPRAALVLAQDERLRPCRAEDMGIRGEASASVPAFAPPVLRRASCAGGGAPAPVHERHGSIMGEHAFYVWGSFGLLLTAIVGEVVQLLRRRRAQRDKINATGPSANRQVQI